MRRFFTVLLNLSPWILVVVIVVGALWLAPKPLPLLNFGAAEVVRWLTSIFFIALIVERALEVFIATWRGPEASRLEGVIQNCKDEIARIKEARKAAPQAELELELKPLYDSIDYTKADLTRQKAGTQRAALWTGLVLGVLVSAAGFRLVQYMVDPAALADLEITTPSQVIVLRLVDVLLTGGLIAGGSEGIHKIVKVFLDFTDSTRARIAAGNK